MVVNTVFDDLGLARDLNTQPVPSNELDQNTFLRLFITQLEHQDPLNPTANEEFVAQLAQFSSLEQATQTTALLEELIAQNGERGRIEAVELIGHGIEALGNTVELPDNGAVNMVYNLVGEATAGTITISDQIGTVVRTITLGSQAAGRQSIEWDGLDDQENPVPAGVYQFSVNPLDADGLGVGVTTFLRESVKSALWDDGQTSLILASGKTLSTNDVLSVY